MPSSPAAPSENLPAHAPQITQVLVLAPRIPDQSGGATALLTLGEEFVRRGTAVHYVSIWPGRSGEPPRHASVTTVHPDELLHRRPLLRDPEASAAQRLARLPLFAVKRLSQLTARRRLKDLFEHLDAHTAVIVTHSDALGAVRALGIDPLHGGALWIGQHHSQFASLQHEAGLRASILENYRDIHAFVALTEQDAEAFANVLTCPAFAIPNAVAPPAALSRNAGEPHAVALARLAPEKQHDLMIRAFTRAVRTGALPGWHLTIHGEGPLQPALEALVQKLGAQDIIDLPGPAAGPDEAFAEASVHLMTSVYEGLPMAALEAASRGVPTIALDCSPGLREIVRPGSGRLVAPLTEDAFARTLQEDLADGALLRGWSEEAPRSAARFAARNIVPRWEHLFADDSLRNGRRAVNSLAVVCIPHLHARGGAEKYAARLATALVGEGWDVVLATRGSTTLVADGKYLGVDLSAVVPLEIPEPPASLPRAVAGLLQDASLRRRIRQLGADLLVNCGYKSELPGCARRSVYVCHFPHRIDQRYEGRARAVYMRAIKLARRLLSGGRGSFLDTYDAFVANSRYTQNHMWARWGVAARVIHPPCAPQKNAAFVRRRRILSVGRFEHPTPGVPHKSQHVLLDAFRRLAPLHSAGWELHLAGTVSPDGDQYLERLRAEAKGLPVVFHPDASPEELAELYASSCIYWHAQGFGEDTDASPESQEHFGMTTVEAMSAGVIPVVIGTAGPAEVVEPLTGVVTWSSLDELCAETFRIAELPAGDREHLARECARRAADFDDNSFVDSLRDLVDAILPRVDAR